VTTLDQSIFGISIQVSAEARPSNTAPRCKGTLMDGNTRSRIRQNLLIHHGRLDSQVMHTRPSMNGGHVLGLPVVGILHPEVNATSSKKVEGAHATPGFASALILPHALLYASFFLYLVQLNESVRNLQLGSFRDGPP